MSIKVQAPVLLTEALAGICWNFNYLLQYIDISSRPALANSEHGEKPRVLLGMRAFVPAARGQIQPCIHIFRLVLLL